MAEQSGKWAEFRKRRRFALIVLIASVSWLGLAILLPRTMKFHDPLVGALMAVWFAVWVYSMAQLLLVRCPRCGGYFSQTRLMKLMFLAERCVKCGIQKIRTGELRVADYGAAWREYRKRRNLAIAGLIWFVLTPVVISRVPGFVSLSAGWAYAVVMASSAIAILPFLWLLLFRCPRCGAVFTHKGPWANNVVARKCGNCGLGKYSNG